MFEIQILAWDRHKNVAGLNQFMGSLPSRLGNWISNDNTCFKQLMKTCTDSLPLKKTTDYHKNE